MKMTIDEIFEAINNAPKEDKVKVAKRVLKNYNEEDKAIVEPLILEGAIVEQYS
jgi:hypothetical protein